jgi:hypothetical protein
MVFDGSDDCVDCGASPRALVGSSSAFSVSAWINMDDDTNEYICGAMESSAERFYFRVQDASGTGYLRWGYGDTASTDTDGVISLNEWHHVVWTYDTTNAKIYIDGVLKNTTAVSGKTITNTDNLYIGALNNNGSVANYLDGLINEAAIWDVALDADAVTALYNSGTPLDVTEDSGNYDNSGDLQGYWRNDNDTTWTDRSTNSNDGTVSGSPDSIVLTEGLTSGRDSQGFYLTDTTENCLTLNGAEYVEIPDSDVLSFGDGINDRPFSIEFWGNAESGALYPFFIWKGSANRANVEYWIQITTGQILFYVGDVTGHSNRLGRFENLDVRDGNWHHYTFTYDGSGTEGGMKFYYDTSRVDDSSDSAGSYTAMHNSTKPLVIGRNGNDGTIYADSRIDDVRIYSQELSSDEITKNYNAGKSKHS